MSRHESKRNGCSEIESAKLAESADGRRGSHAERRHASREALLEATLDLTNAGLAFESLSLRRIATTAGLAASAFYRYFPSMDDLEVALVDESFTRLRAVLVATDMSSVFAAPDAPGESARVLIEFTAEQRRHLAFVARQRVAGSDQARRLIRAEIRVVTSQFAFILARYPPMTTWPIRDNEMLAGLVVSILMRAIDRLLSSGAEVTSAARADVTADVAAELTYLLVATRHWHPR